MDSWRAGSFGGTLLPFLSSTPPPRVPTPGLSPDEIWSTSLWPSTLATRMKDTKNAEDVSWTRRHLEWNWRARRLSRVCRKNLWYRYCGVQHCAFPCLLQQHSSQNTRGAACSCFAGGVFPLRAKLAFPSFPFSRSLSPTSKILETTLSGSKADNRPSS